MRTTPFDRVGVIGIAALAAAALVSGCATSKSGTPSTASTAAVTSAAAASSSAGTATQTATASTVKATGGGKFCQQVAATINAASARIAAGGTGADAMKATIKESQSIEGAVIKSAPNDIKSDLVVVFGAADKLYAALAAANYDYTKLDPTAMTALTSPAVAAAEKHITTYMKTTCGLDLGGASASSS